jgi:HK97 family phage major capsid protein
MKQAKDPERYIRRELLKTAGEVIDTAVLNGSGASGQPRGIINITTISTQTGTSLDRADVLAMKKNAADANAAEETISFIGTTAVAQLLEGRTNETGGGTYIWQDGKIVNCRAYASTTMPSATLLSGAMSEVTLGLWGSGITIETNPYDPVLFKTGVVQLRVIVLCDVALGCAPTAFTKATSIT